MENNSLDDMLEALIVDPRMVELCELQRTGDEVLDVISLSENQHSDILAWMLDPREGHGQGDEILRDLLISASTRAASGESGLDGRKMTARFFSNWPASRIKTTGFGAAFVARELGMKAAERVDLFVIDAQNKFVLLIENKARAAHTVEQLDLYERSFSNLVEANPPLRSYAWAYIALDQEFEDDQSDPRPACGSWLHLGYDWLKISATRALMHVARGNAAAKLVVTYCNRQTDWESPDKNRCIELAASLHQSHSQAVQALIDDSPGRAERNWLTNTRQEDVFALFRLQNKGAVAFLRDTRGMASVRTALLEKMPSLKPESVRHKRTTLDILPAFWLGAEVSDSWPVFFSVRYQKSNGEKYNLALCWKLNDSVSETRGQELRECLASVLPDFNTHRNSRWRRVVIDRGLDMNSLSQKIADFDRDISSALSAKATESDRSE